MVSSLYSTRQQYIQQLYIQHGGLEHTWPDTYTMRLLPLRTQQVLGEDRSTLMEVTSCLT